MRAQLRIGRGLSWAIAWLLVVAAIVGSLLWPFALMWWISLALVLPLVGLAAWRQDRTSSPDESYGIADGGPWGPPR